MPASDVARPGDQAGELVSMVEAASDDELAGLLRARPDLLVVAPRGPRALAEALVSAESLRLFHAGADRSARQAMEALCLVDDPVSAVPLAALLGCQPGDVGGVLARLRTAWVVLGPEPGMVRNSGLRRAFPRPGVLGPPLRDGLQAQSVDELGQIARRLGLAPRMLKPVLVEALAVAVPNPVTVAEVIAAGPLGTAELAQRMAFSPGGADPDHGFYNSYTSYNAVRSTHTPIGWLASRGIVVPDAGWWSVHMPAEVALVLRGGRLFPEPFLADAPVVARAAMDVGATDHAAAAIALKTVADIATVAEAWSTGPAKLLHAGGLGVKEVRRVGKLTGRSERDGARLVERAGRAGLVARDLAQFVALPTDGYDRWASLPAPQRAASLARAGMFSPTWLSYAGALDEKGKAIPPLTAHSLHVPGANAILRRAAVLKLLSTMPPGYGADVGDFMTRVLWDRPALWDNGPAASRDLVGWALEEAADVGMIAVSKAASVGPGNPATAVVTLTSFGRAACAGAGLEGFDEEAFGAGITAFCPTSCPEVFLQADLTAVAPGELPLEVRRELELLADVESKGGGTVYRFSEASLRRGFDQGRSAAGILAFLSDHAPKGIPQPLAYLVDDVGRRFGEARTGFASSYVRTDDPALLAAVVATKKLARLGLRLVAPTVAVSEVEPLGVLRGLREAGYMTAAEGPEGQVIDLGAPAARRVPTPPEGRAQRAAQGAPGAPAATLRAEEAVQQLRKAPPLAPGVGFPTRPGAGEQAEDPDIEDWELGAALFDLDELDVRRPTHIAKTGGAVRELLGQAFANDWLVRLCYVDPEGNERERFAEVLEVEGDAIYVHRLGDDEGDDVGMGSVRWARVLTRAEEELYLDQLGAP